MFWGLGKEMFWELGDEMFWELGEDLFWGVIEKMFWVVLSMPSFRCNCFARFRGWNSIYRLCRMKTLFMFIQLPLVDHLALDVQLLQIQIHSVHSSFHVSANSKSDVHAIQESPRPWPGCFPLPISYGQAWGELFLCGCLFQTVLFHLCLPLGSDWPVEYCSFKANTRSRDVGEPEWGGRS